MSSFVYEKFKEQILQAGLNLSSLNLKVVAVNLANHGKAITGATNATPIVITSTSHGFSNGDVVMISGVGGNTNANGIFRVANVAANTFELTNITTGANIAGSGAYTSGGYIVSVSTHQYLSDITGSARIATSANLGSKTFTLGVFDAADVTFSAVSGAVIDAYVIYNDTGVAGTSNLIAWLDGYTNLPITPNGGDIVMQHDSGRFKIFQI